MKIRQGFVSNSSTSSFIVKGYIVPTANFNFNKFKLAYLQKNPELAEKLKALDEDERYWEFSYRVRDDGYYITDSSEDGAPYGDCIIGELIYDSDEYIPDMILDCSESEKLLELKQVLKDFVDEDYLKIKVIVGTRAC